MSISSHALTKKEILLSWEKTLKVMAEREGKKIDAKTHAEDLMKEIVAEKVKQDRLNNKLRKIINTDFFIIHCEEELNERVEQIEALLDEGLDIDEVDNYGQTLLDYALQSSNFLFAIRLLNLGAQKAVNIDYVNNDGATLLDFAVSIKDIYLILKLISLNAKATQKALATLQEVIEYTNQSAISFNMLLNPGDEQSCKLQQFIHLMKVKKMAEIKKQKAAWEKTMLEYEYRIKEFTSSDSYAPLSKNGSPYKPMLRTLFENSPHKNNIKAMKEHEPESMAVYVFLEKIKAYNEKFAETMKIFYDIAKTPNRVVKEKSVAESLSEFQQVLQYFSETISAQKGFYRELKEEANQIVASLPPRLSNDNKKLILDVLLDGLEKQEKLLSKWTDIARKFYRDYYKEMLNFGFYSLNEVTDKKVAVKKYLEHVKNYVADINAKLKSEFNNTYGNSKFIMTTYENIIAKYNESAYEFSYDKTVEALRKKQKYGSDEAMHDAIFRSLYTIKVDQENKLNEAILLQNYIRQLKANKIESSTAADTKPSADIPAMTLMEVLANDRKVAKEAEQNAREERAMIHLAKLEKEALEKEKIETRQYLHKTRMEEKKRLIEIIRGNKLTDEAELLCQILKKENLIKIQDKDLLQLFGEKEPKLPPFKIEETAEGYMIKLHSTTIASFHRQHGKPVNIKVFNALCDALRNRLGLELSDLQNIWSYQTLKAK